MNDENDKPKNLSNEDDWSMTMPHKRLDKEIEAEKYDDYAPKYDSSNQQPPADDWGMTTPNINIPSQSQPPASSDFDKTTPNINIPQNTWEEEKPKAAPQSNQPADDWSMTTPNINITKEDVNLKKEEKKDDWEMPEPTFRVSSGMTGVYKMPQGQPDGFDKPSPDMDFSVESTGDDISSDKTTPNFRISEEKLEDYGQAAPDAATQPQAAVPSVAPQESQPVPAKKPMSKLPFIIGSLLTLLFLGGASLAAVYFLLLRQPETTRVLPPVAEKSENVPLSNTSNSSESSPSLTTTQPALPQEINYKGSMLLVSAGEFTMGSDTSEDEAAKPAHKIMLPAFYIDKYEVTNAQYKEYCDANGKSYPPDFLEKDYFLKRPNAPVIGVSFYDARGYADWAGKRLPSEEEWEKAASWDEAKQTKIEFPWGNDFQNEKAAFNLTTISDVGKYSGDASPYGVMDMSGNVLEWVDAFYKPYPSNTTTNSAFGEKNRVVRGGFFKAPDAKWLKTTKRTYIPPDTASSEDETKQVVPPIGFRCAVSADNAGLKDSLQSK